jgi:hypothetical protein
MATSAKSLANRVLLSLCGAASEAVPPHPTVRASHAASARRVGFLSRWDWMLTLRVGQAETLWDEALRIEVRELPEDLAQLDVLLGGEALFAPIVEHWRRRSARVVTRRSRSSRIAARRSPPCIVGQHHVADSRVNTASWTTCRRKPCQSLPWS